MTDGEHVEQRPAWTCRACGRPWPCQPARASLLRELDPTALRISMWLRLEVAAGDLYGMSVADAYGRFIAWTGEARTR